MIKVIKDDDKYICKRLIPKDIDSSRKYHFQKLLYADAFEFINAKSGEFFEFEYIEQELPDDDPKCIDWKVLLLIVKKYKLDQFGMILTNNNEEYKV